MAGGLMVWWLVSALAFADCGGYSEVDGLVFSALPDQTPVLLQKDALDLETEQLSVWLDGGKTPWDVEVTQEALGGGVTRVSLSEPWPRDRNVVLNRRGRIVVADVPVEDRGAAVPVRVQILGASSWRSGPGWCGIPEDNYQLEVGPLPPIPAYFEVQHALSSDFSDARSAWSWGEGRWFFFSREAGTGSPWVRVRMWVQPALPGPWSEAQQIDASGCDSTGGSSVAWLGVLVLGLRRRRSARGT